MHKEKTWLSGAQNVPTKFELPSVATADEAQRASSALLAATAAGALSPADGRRLMDMLVAHKSILEASELERRIAGLEKELMQFGSQANTSCPPINTKLPR